MLKNLLVLMFAVLLVQCGQKGSPSGGEKDTTPPKILESSPAYKAINFNGQTIELKFDEYITVRGFYNEFLISPPVLEKPRFKVKGKKLILEFDSAFSKNTTYNLFFGKAIKDLNEGNILAQNSFVFSTGDFIDSLSFSGQVFNGKDYTATTSGMVHLYRDYEDDSIPSKTIPSYFAQIDKGVFQFTNLAAGKYKIFVLDDVNGNYLYDLPNELIAFRKEPVVIDSNAIEEDLKLISFVAEKEDQFIKDQKYLQRGKLSMVFNQKVQDFKLEILGDESKVDWGILEWNDNTDSLIVWSAYLSELDTFKLIIQAQGLSDTVSYITGSKKSWDKIGVEVSSNFDDFANFSGKDLVLLANCPLASFDFSAAELWSVKDTVPLVGKTGEKSQEISISNQIRSSEEYTIVLPPNSLQSIFGVSNTDTLKIAFNTADPAAFCSVVFKYDFTQVGESGILEFYADKRKVQTFKISDLKGVINLPGFKPGKYKFKFIADKDKNGKWSSGNYYLNKQPEKVYWYKEEVQIRANWEMEVDWVLIP